LEFDREDREYFSVLKGLDDYRIWSEKEKDMVEKNSVCSICEYVGRCNTEHYRDLKSLEEGCSGSIKLIKWFNNYDKSAPCRTI